MDANRGQTRPQERKYPTRLATPPVHNNRCLHSDGPETSHEFLYLGAALGNLLTTSNAGPSLRSTSSGKLLRRSLSLPSYPFWYLALAISRRSLSAKEGIEHRPSGEK